MINLGAFIYKGLSVGASLFLAGYLSNGNPHKAKSESANSISRKSPNKIGRAHV